MLKDDALREAAHSHAQSLNTGDLGVKIWIKQYIWHGRQCVSFQVAVQGSVAQNRAVEGDVVALEILSPSSWFISSALVKASNGGASALHPSASTPAALGDGALELPDEGSPEAPAATAEGCCADVSELPIEAQRAGASSVPDEPTSGATPAASCRGSTLPFIHFLQRSPIARPV